MTVLKGRVAHLPLQPSSLDRLDQRYNTHILLYDTTFHTSVKKPHERRSEKLTQQKSTPEGRLSEFFQPAPLSTRRSTNCPPRTCQI